MCKSCGWETLADTADAIAKVPGFKFAIPTLLGIAKNVRFRRHATENQQIAVFNIKEGRKLDGGRANHRPGVARIVYLPRKHGQNCDFDP